MAFASAQDRRHCSERLQRSQSQPVRRKLIAGLVERKGHSLANTKSAIKRIRSSAKRQARGRRVRTEARTFIKAARAKISDGELDAAKESVAVAVRALDKAAEKGIIHKNNAARRKSRLLQGLAEAGKDK